MALDKNGLPILGPGKRRKAGGLSSFVVCPTCNGKKWVEESGPLGIHIFRTLCDTCRGTGRVWRKKT